MPVYQTCDVCRKRKTKCLPPADDNEKHDKKAPCINCARLGINCTYEHVYRRPGRPTSFARKSLSGEGEFQARSTSPTTSFPRQNNATQARRESSSFDAQPRVNEAGPSTAYYPRVSISGHPEDQAMSAQLARPTAVPSGPSVHPATLSPTSIFHPPNIALNRTLYPEPAQFSSSPAGLDPMFMLSSNSPNRGIDESFNLSEWSEHDLVTDWPTASTSGSGLKIAAAMTPAAIARDAAPPQPSIRVSAASAEPSAGLSGSSTDRNSHRLAHRPLPTGSTDIQMEDVAPWNTISFFITLYLGYSHSLFPMVHRPSFSQSLAMRRDKVDRDFRALVLGIVAYTIGQSPLGRMTSDFNRAELASLQHRSHRASMMLLDRSYRNPNVMHVGTLIAGYFYCQSVGKTTRALTLLAEACQLMHLLRMHDDEATAALGLDAVDIQVRRRIWWHIHAVDITEASAGNKIHLNSFEGRPSLPLEVDDEFLTSQGSFPQPPNQTSYMLGFVACIRQFPLLEEPIMRMRTLQYRRRRGHQYTFEEVEAELRWIESALLELDGIMQGLPDILKLGWTFDEPMDEIRLAVMGMQRANLAITAVSIRFALAEYKAELVQPGTISLDSERAAMGKEAYETLSCIGLDDLAANGESMRGKIFRILLSLLKCNGESQDWFNTLQDWWSLFSRVQFVQLMAPNVDSRLPSRANSPEPAG